MGVTTTEHDYRVCRDEWCDRFPCRIYREGYRDGAEDARPVAYGEGFADGISACPLPHGGG